MPSLQKLAALFATQTRESFLADLGGEAVLVRLDERGGKDEPAPWAFHAPPGANTSSTGGSLPPREDDSVDAESLRGALENTQKMKKLDVTSDVFRVASADDETKTQALPPPSLPVPPARGAATVHIVKLVDGKARVGRTSGVEIEIPEMSLSRRHASLSSHPKDRGAISVRDMGSRNGTRVNGKALERDEERKLRSGDVVAFGDVECLFLEASDLVTHLPRLTD